MREKVKEIPFIFPGQNASSRAVLKIGASLLTQRSHTSHTSRETERRKKNYRERNMKEEKLGEIIQIEH